jgi:hypothetical protein
LIIEQCVVQLPIVYMFFTVVFVVDFEFYCIMIR